MVQHLVSQGIAIDSVLEAATEFFGEDLSNVRVCVDHAPLRFGALAIAHGDTIHLHPDVMQWSADRRREVLGHELSHIVQQRAGRTIPRKTIAGVAICDDPTLEAEAHELGRRFARYCSSAQVKPRSPKGTRVRAAHGGGVVQCLVTLGSKSLGHIAELSEHARLVLSLIAQGESWLKWAIGETSDRHLFPDENALLSGIQLGLHSTPLVLLPKTQLLVGATKLFSMSIQAVKTLIANEATSTETSAMQARSTLSANDLKTQDNLVTIDEFLRQAGVAKAPVFQAMNLVDRIAIFDLMRMSEAIAAMSPALRSDAARFAVSLASNPVEFVDLYKIYYQVALRQSLMDVDTATRDPRVRQVWDTLVPIVLPWLDCPSFGKMLTPEMLHRSLQRWGGAGGSVGFTRLSSAVFQVVANSVYVSQTGADARNVVATFAREAQSFLLAHAPAAAYVSQDGLSCSYVAQSESLEARLQSTNLGMTTITSFSARRKSAQPQPTQGPEFTRTPTNPLSMLMPRTT